MLRGIYCLGVRYRGGQGSIISESDCALRDTSAGSMVVLWRYQAILTLACEKGGGCAFVSVGSRDDHLPQCLAIGSRIGVRGWDSRVPASESRLALSYKCSWVGKVLRFHRACVTVSVNEALRYCAGGVDSCSSGVRSWESTSVVHYAAGGGVCCIGDNQRR